MYQLIFYSQSDNLNYFLCQEDHVIGDAAEYITATEPLLSGQAASFCIWQHFIHRL